MSSSLFSVLEGALSSLARLVLFLSGVSFILSCSHKDDDEEEEKEKKEDLNTRSKTELGHIDTRNNMHGKIDENDTFEKSEISPLHRQNMFLAANPHVDYVLFDTTANNVKVSNTHSYVGITFHDKRMRVTFRVLRNRAPTDPYCVFKMHDILEAHVSANNRLIVHGQLRKEYGIDPSSAFAMYSPIHVSSIQEDEATKAMNELGFLEATSVSANGPPIRSKQYFGRSKNSYEDRIDTVIDEKGEDKNIIRHHRERSSARKNKKKSRRKR